MERERGSAAVAVSGAMKPEISRLKSLKPPIFTAVRRVPVDVGCSGARHTTSIASLVASRRCDRGPGWAAPGDESELRRRRGDAATNAEGRVVAVRVQAVAVVDIVIGGGGVQVVISAAAAGAVAAPLFVAAAASSFHLRHL